MEILRVLKRGGVIFVVNKNDTGDFGEGYRAIFKNFIGHELPDMKKDYQPAVILKDYFENVQEEHFQEKEFWTLREALMYLQLISIWNLVPENYKKEALKALEDFCKNKMTFENLIERKIEIVAVLGRKARV